MKRAKRETPMSTMDELKKLALWEPGHRNDEDEIPEGEGSLIPGLEDRRGSVIVAFVEACGEDDEDEMIFIDGDEILGRLGPGDDACKNMTDAQCKEWDAQTEEHKDEFTAGGDSDGPMAVVEPGEGACEHMDDKDCAKWNANTEQYKDVVKDKHRSAMGDLEHLAGAVPGVPDGTGPRGKSPECKKKDDEDTSDKSAMDDLEKLAGIEKEAINQQTKDFVEWAANQQPMTENEVVRMLKMAGLKEILPPSQGRPGPRFQQGDDVIVNADKHKNRDTLQPYLENNGKVGVVVGVEGEGVFVQFKSGQPVLFEDGQERTRIGLYKYTPAFVMQGSKKIEMIYEAAGKPTNDQKIIVEQYLDRGKTVKRETQYYTGHAFSARYSKAGTVYFHLFPQQRMEVSTEAGFQARSFNPSKGKLRYMGLFGKRPRNWEQELADMRGGSMVMSSLAQLEHLASSTVPGDELFPEESGDEMLGVSKGGDACEHLTEAECAEFRANTEKYKDVVKDKNDKSSSMGKTAGYTNYWTIKEPFTPDEWNVIKLAASKAWDMGRRVKKIPAKSPVWKKVYADYVAKNGVVLKGPNGSGRPEIGDDAIAFNGDGSARISVELDADTSHPWTYDSDLAHESFYFPNETGRNFCKTERKPYDMAVASVLWWAKKTAPKKIDIGSDDGKPIKIFATDADKLAAEIADVSERAFNWFSEVGQKFEKLPWEKAIDGLGRAISNKSRAEDVLDDLTDLDESKMKAMLSKGGEKKLKDWLKSTFKKRGSMDVEVPARERLTQKQARPQMLLPKNIRSKIPKLYSQENNPDPIVWVKFFNAYGRGTWLITEFDGRDTMFGLADLGHPELGYVSLSELESLEKMPGLQQIERDSSFRPKPLSEAAKKEGISWRNPRLARERMTTRTAAREPGGLYGFTKKVQADCEAASRRLAKAAVDTARQVYAKDQRVARFLSTHAERSDSLSAKILVAALQEMGPKFAADIKKQARLEELRAERGVTAAGFKNGDKVKLDPRLNASKGVWRKIRRDTGTVVNDWANQMGEIIVDWSSIGYMGVHQDNLVKVGSDKTAKFKVWDNRFLKPADVQGFGDRRFQYVPFTDLDSSQQNQVKRTYVNVGCGKPLDPSKPYRPGMPTELGPKYDFGAEHFYYPVKQDGSLARARRIMAIPRKMLDDDRYMSSLGYAMCPDWVEAQAEGRVASDKTAKAKYGLYGYKAKTANLGLGACNHVREEAGRIASDLHGRRADKHARITEFLRNRSKRGRCLYSRMLVRSYPDADMKIASVKPASVNDWLAWED